MENLTELEAFIRNLCPEVEILQNSSISYIKSFTDEDKFIFICGRSHKNGFEYISTESSIKSPHLDLTGSPLKDDLLDVLSVDLNLSKDDNDNLSKEHLNPLEIQKSLLILNHVNINNEKIFKDCIWVLCKFYNSISRNIILLSSKFSHKFFRHATVLNCGQISANKIIMKDLMKIHGNQIGRVKIDTTIESTLHISKNIYLKTFWNTSLTSINAVSLNNFKNSDITLYQIVEIGKPSYILSKLWEDIVILYNIRNDIENYNNVNNDFDTKEFCNSYNAINLEEIREKILSLLTNVPEIQDEEIKPQICEIEGIIKNIENRSCLDINDKLWEILKCCHSYNDLKLAFNFLWFCAEKCNIINMPNTNSQIGEIISDISSRRIAPPNIIGTKHLKLLLEIGIEKILKDYNYVFLTSKVCNPDQLNSLGSNFNCKNFAFNNDYHDNDIKKNKSMQKDSLAEPIRKSMFHNFNDECHNSNDSNIEYSCCSNKFDKIALDNKLSRIFQYYIALEHLLIHVNLNLNNNYYQLCEQLLKKPIKSYQNVIQSSIDKIEVPIMVNDVLHLLQNRNPQERKIILNSKNNFKEIKNIFYFNENNIFPSTVKDTDPDMMSSRTEEKNNISKENMYYCWHIIDVKTRIQ